MEDTVITNKYQELHPQRKQQDSKEEGEVIQLIVFHLGDEEFGADINQVREIIRAGTVTPIPDSPDFIKGVTNVRGEIAVVIDLKKRFSLHLLEIEERHIIMTEQANNLFGLMVDEVSEVLRIPKLDFKATPELVTKIDRVYISGVLTLENRLIIMLDLSKVLSEDELTKLSEISIRHRNAMEKAQEGAEKKAKAQEEMKVKVEAKAKEVKVEIPVEPAGAKKARKK
jgi:purine-binding chemotaxis protein CheW